MSSQPSTRTAEPRTAAEFADALIEWVEAHGWHRHAEAAAPAGLDEADVALVRGAIDDLCNTMISEFGTGEANESQFRRERDEQMAALDRLLQGKRND